PAPPPLHRQQRPPPCPATACRARRAASRRRGTGARGCGEAQHLLETGHRHGGTDATTVSLSELTHCNHAERRVPKRPPGCAANRDDIAINVTAPRSPASR